MGQGGDPLFDVMENHNRNEISRMVSNPFIEGNCMYTMYLLSDGAKFILD